MERETAPEENFELVLGDGFGDAEHGFIPGELLVLRARDLDTLRNMLEEADQRGYSSEGYQAGPIARIIAEKVAKDDR